MVKYLNLYPQPNDINIYTKNTTKAFKSYTCVINKVDNDCFINVNITGFTNHAQIINNLI